MLLNDPVANGRVSAGHSLIELEADTSTTKKFAVHHYVTHRVFRVALSPVANFVLVGTALRRADLKWPIVVALFAPEGAVTLVPAPAMQSRSSRHRHRVDAGLCSLGTAVDVGGGYPESAQVFFL